MLLWGSSLSVDGTWLGGEVLNPEQRAVVGVGMVASRGWVRTEEGDLGDQSR